MPIHGPRNGNKPKAQKKESANSDSFVSNLSPKQRENWERILFLFGINPIFLPKEQVEEAINIFHSRIQSETDKL